MVCLDTSFIADLNRKDIGAIAKLKVFIENREKLVTTVINVAESYKGAYGHHNAERKLKEVDELILILFVLEMNVRASKNYGYFYHYLKKSGLETIKEEELKDLTIRYWIEKDNYYITRIENKVELEMNIQGLVTPMELNSAIYLYDYNEKMEIEAPI